VYHPPTPSDGCARSGFFMPHIAGETYEVAIDPFATGVDWGQWVSPGSPFSVGTLYNPVSDPGIFVAAPEIFPTVRVLDPGRPETGQGNGEVVGVASVPDPEYLPTGTVYEDAPGGIYERENPVPTDWDAVYEAYVELNQPEVDVVIDWANAAGQFMGGLLDPFGIGSATENMFGFAAPPAGVPSSTAAPQVVVNPVTGQVTRKPCRRRRRRLLTDGDFNDLMRISTLPNKDIVKIALAKAVGR